jgi:hypothetical protein
MRVKRKLHIAAACKISKSTHHSYSEPHPEAGRRYHSSVIAGYGNAVASGMPARPLGQNFQPYK